MPLPHSTALYVPRGRGTIYIAAWAGLVAPSESALTEIGNCPSFEIEPVQERAPHYSSRTGLRLRDLNPVISTEYNFNFTCDELAAQNFAKFFLGTYVAASASVLALQNVDAEYYIKFVSDNPIGPQYEIRLWRTTIGPNGPLAIIGDDYLVMDFAGEGLADETNHATSPYFTLRYITTTTTSTTTTTTA